MFFFTDISFIYKLWHLHTKCHIKGLIATPLHSPLLIPKVTKASQTKDFKKSFPFSENMFIFAPA